MKYKILTLKLWLPVAVWALVIFSLSSVKTLKVHDFIFWDFIAKKGAHVFEYMILYFLIFRATKGKFILSFALTAGYALSDEFHQKFVPGRNSSLLDLGFDITGANIASYISWKLKQTRRKKQKK